jgi:CheY-like chemotaxis protein
MDPQPIRQDEPQPAPNPIGYVMVVDDEELVRTFLARCLESGGYVVQQAATAEQALAAMTAEPASVVMCDVRMPEQDGLWLAERLRAQWPSTRVVMVTGIDDLETIRQCRELGAVDYVTKPILPEQLLKVVRRAATAPVLNELVPKPDQRDEVVAAIEKLQIPDDSQPEAEYMLESPVRCPACAELITSVRAVRLIRAHVNITSTLPRRGHVLACPNCLAVVPAELSNI